MTCIVGLLNDGKVLMGGDSAGVAGLDLQLRADGKIFTKTDTENNVWVFGFTTSFRMGQLIQYELELPQITENDHADLHGFMVKKFIPSFRKCLRDGGWLRKVEEREWGGNFLIGVLGELFEIDNDYQVIRPLFPYAAVGCGANMALGALYASEGQPAKKRVLLALKAAEAFSAGVRKPFKIVETVTKIKKR